MSLETLSVSHTLDSSPEGRAFAQLTERGVLHGEGREYRTLLLSSPLGGAGTAQAVTERVSLSLHRPPCRCRSDPDTAGTRSEPG